MDIDLSQKDCATHQLVSLKGEPPTRPVETFLSGDKGFGNKNENG